MPVCKGVRTTRFNLDDPPCGQGPEERVEE